MLFIGPEASINCRMVCMLISFKEPEKKKKKKLKVEITLRVLAFFYKQLVF